MKLLKGLLLFLPFSFLPSSLGGTIQITGTDGSSNVLDFNTTSFYNQFNAAVTYTLVSDEDILTTLTAIGGSGGSVHISTPRTTNFGGLGGTSQGQFTFVQGQVYKLIVGSVGQRTRGGVPGGGGNTASRTAGGGGYTGFFLDSISHANSILIAGGGGGCGNLGAASIGGVGGGLQGGNANVVVGAVGGEGGTQTSGGGCDPICHWGASQEGSELLGGSGRSGGGGGYYGGGGGGYTQFERAGGGGGGSSYIHPTYISNGSTTHGAGRAPSTGGPPGSFAIGFVSYVTSPPTLSPTLAPSQEPTNSPTSHIKPWLVGPTTYSVEGGNNEFDGYLKTQNEIGGKVTENVQVQLFDHGCLTEMENFNSTNAVNIFFIDPNPSTFYYNINISQSNIENDTGGFVHSTGPTSGDVKFCTRVSTFDGSTEVAFRETNFVLSYDLSNNTFVLSDIEIEENDPDSFITIVDTDFSVKVYQCNNFIETIPPRIILQDESLVLCLEPFHTEGMESAVRISNFNLQMYAGSDTENNYVEYNPVRFGTNGWKEDALTNIQVDISSDIVMISTPVIAQFFVLSHTSISVSGNCFLEFDSAKKASAPVFMDYETQFGIDGGVKTGCLAALLRRIQALF